MEAKQKAIQEAYGEHWESVKDYVDEYGWFSSNQIFYFGNKEEEALLDIVIGLQTEKSLDSKCIRPLSLQGIENNNGWIRIESEKDLPKELIFYNACNKHDDFEEVPMFYGLNLSKLENYYKSEIITHYQPIQKPKPPIY